MKLKNIFIFITLLFGAVLITGCAGPYAGPSCPTCANPSPWSECNQEGAKTRTNYKCSEETNYTCESYTEEKACETQINLKGAKGALDIVIAPTLDESVKGIIKVEAVSVPEGTEMIKFIFAPQEVEIGPAMDISKVVIETDASGSDGWRAFFDTSKVDNGLFRLFIGSTYEGAPDANPWLDYTNTQMIVKN